MLKGNGQTGTCFVGVYGWTCDVGLGASDFDSANAAYLAILNAAAAGEGSSDSSVVATAEMHPPCTTLCVSNCTPPCDDPCALQLFEAERGSYADGTQHFYIDPWGGGDGEAGNATSSPWATVRRGQAQLRWARVSQQAAPVQLWQRAEPNSSRWRALQLQT